MKKGRTWIKVWTARPGDMFVYANKGIALLLKIQGYGPNDERYDVTVLVEGKVKVFVTTSGSNMEVASARPRG